MRQLSILVFFLCSSKLIAAGSINRDQSAFSAGMSQAAESTNVNDPSGLWGNPAVTAWQKDQAVNLTMRYSAPNSNFSDALASINYEGNTLDVKAKSSGDDFLSSLFLPSVYGQHQISELLAFGWGVVVPVAGELQYDKSWMGRYDSIENKIFAANVEADLVFKLGENLALSAGFSYQLSNLEFVFSLPDSDNVDQSISSSTELSSAGDTVNEYKGDSQGYGFQLGSSYRLGLKTLLGFSFRSQIVSENEGRLRRSAGTTVSSQKADTTSATPSVFNLGASYLVIKDFQVYLNASYSLWSIKESMLIAVDDTSYQRELDWSDTYLLSLGLNYRSKQHFQYRAGFSYETSPQNSDYETTSYILTDKYSFSVGLSAEVSKITIDFAYSYDLRAKSDMSFTREIEANTDYSFEADYLVGSNNFLLSLTSQI